MSETKDSRHVFIDESGDPYLQTEKAGVSKFFVLSAIIVDDDQLSEVDKKAREVIQRRFQTGEMKSATVGGDTRRRLKILQDISSVPFRHYSQVVDKSEVLTSSGLRYKKSFIKFIHRSMYQRLLQSHHSLHVIADEHGTSDFMREFGSYLEKRLPLNLFERSSFRFGDSRNYPLIQFGDMIAGTIARVYSGVESLEVLEPLRKQTIIIDEWPPKIPVHSSTGTMPDNSLDIMVRQQAVSQAQKFVDDYTESEDTLIQAQVATVRYLLYHFRSVDPEEYIPTSIARRHLQELGHEMSERMLRAQVIGHLRDSSVFIVSSSKGIKIPFNVEDLRRFVTQVDERVSPYLARLQVLRRHFLLSSSGEIEIIKESEHPNLHKMLRRLPN